MGESRASLGRERYLERMWQFMNETRPIIRDQLRRFGASLDWSRERFTMDEGSARAVRVAFKRLWDAGLVYRGEALVNWCPRCLTTISDLENVHREETGTLWTIRYHLEREDGTPDPDAWISVATTRPETLLGDTAVAVHPGRRALPRPRGPPRDPAVPRAAAPDRRRRACRARLRHRRGQDHAGPRPDDYELAKRHGLPAINVLDDEARINSAGGDFFGRDRYEAREAILDRLREMGDLEAERPHPMVVGHCERCGTVIEPRLSVQWFIRVKPLAERALASVREGRTKILPPHFEKVYAHWMENIHDWAVGRQLWWGHRIPAWFCPDGHVTVSDAEAGPDACAECGRPASDLAQETDIFDTWFSSGLWPFSTLGWPDETPDMARFYPTSVMETGYDILFFWVARMMMLGLFLTDAEPFHTVYLHGMIRAEGGIKMSKTKGNSVDPLDMVEEIGADALRFALVNGSAPGSDMRLTQAKLDGGRNFTNKLWNAARFVLANRPEAGAAGTDEPTLAVRWIGSRLADATARATRQLDALDLGGYAATVYEVAWSDYCDWFLEMAKVDLRREDATDAERAATWAAAADGLATLLRLLHPLMPFVTEEIWQALREAAPETPQTNRCSSPRAGRRPGERDPRPRPRSPTLPRWCGACATCEPRQARPASAWVPLDGRAGRRSRPPTRIAHRPALPRGAGTGAADRDRRRRGERPSWGHRGPARRGMAGRGRGRGRRVAEDGARRSWLRWTANIARLEELLADASFTIAAPAPVVERERMRLADLGSSAAAAGDGEGGRSPIRPWRSARSAGRIGRAARVRGRSHHVIPQAQQEAGADAAAATDARAGGGDRAGVPAAARLHRPQQRWPATARRPRGGDGHPRHPRAVERDAGGDDRAAAARVLGRLTGHRALQRDAAVGAGPARRQPDRAARALRARADRCARHDRRHVLRAACCTATPTRAATPSTTPSSAGLPRTGTSCPAS